MEKRKWLWKRKASEKSPGETESSGSISSYSERNSDDQEVMKTSPNYHTLSPEVTSKAAVIGEDVDYSVKTLTEKLSAALVNVSAKDELVQQHAKVAEEAVEGWEKAENEVVLLKQQLEVAEQKNSALEDRVSHLDGALKECVRQLRQSKEEQEQRMNEAVTEKAREWEFAKLELESQLIEFQTRLETAESSGCLDPDLPHKFESLEKENSALKMELLTRSKELEISNIERDLSIQAAETASKQHLESIKKVAKLEAECQRLQAMARKSSTLNNHKSIAASSIYVDSLTDSQSDSGEQLNGVERDVRKLGSRVEPNESEASCSDSWASALIAELDQFKNGKVKNKNLAACSIEIDMMDDFLEMERFAALPETENKTPHSQPEVVANESANEENALRAELDAMNGRMTELEGELEKIEAEKAKLENALTESQESLKASQFQLTEAGMRIDELKMELSMVNESKELLEFQLIGMEVETRTLSAKVESLKVEVEKERNLSAELAVKYQGLEDELTRKSQEVEPQPAASSNGELKMKQEDLAVAAGKLAECQKTIASLGRQLKSLATLEDFLIDTDSLPEFSGGGSLIRKAGAEMWKLHSNETFTSKSTLDAPKVPPKENAGPSMNGNNNEESPASSSSTSSSASSNHVGSAKSRNGFVKLFSRSKSGVQVEN